MFRIPDMFGSKTNKKSHSAKDRSVKRRKGKGPKATKGATQKRKRATKQKSKRTTIDTIKKIASSFGVPLAAAALILYYVTKSKTNAHAQVPAAGSGSGAARAGAEEAAAAEAKQQIEEGKYPDLVQQWEQNNPSPSAEQQSVISRMLHSLNKGLESAGKSTYM